MKNIKRIIAFIMCAIMLLSAGVFSNAEEAVQPEIKKQRVVAYFNVSAYPGQKDFTGIDVLNYHPAHIEASAFGYSAGTPIVTHSHSSKLDMWKERAYKQNPDIKFVFTVANGNIQVFESWFSSPARAKTLANEMLSIIKTYGYDGLDIDYEFPQGGNNPKTNYVKFMQYMREGFDELAKETGKDYILSMAVPAGSWAFSLFNMNELSKYVSYFNIMSYDLHVGTATKGITHHHTNPKADPTPGFEGASVEEDIALYREMGIPDDQIVVGIGMYARRWTGVEAGKTNGLYQAGILDETTNEAYLHYSDIRSRYENKNGYVKYWDDVTKSPWLYNAEKKVFLTYDDEQSAQVKCELAGKEDIGGVMVFDYCTADGFGFFDKVRTWLDEAAAQCEHIFGEWTEILAPTYETVGKEKRSCTLCREIEERDIPVKEYVNPFIDVKDTHWFASTVEYCVKKGYVSGMTDTTFVPNGNITRAQFLVMLAALDGADLDAYAGKDSGFEDVKPAHWFNEEVCWAVENGITSGLSETTFGPGNNVTRAQLARFFYVYSEKNGINVEGRADLSAFPDVAKVQEWAKIPMEWAVDAGLISGVAKGDQNYLDPNGTATRAQATVMFKGFDDFRK